MLHKYNVEIHLTPSILSFANRRKTHRPIIADRMGTNMSWQEQSTHLNICIEGAGADEVSIRVEVNAPDVCLVAGKGAHDLGRLQVPDLECTAERPSTHQLLRPTKPHTLNGGGVAREALRRREKRCVFRVWQWMFCWCDRQCKIPLVQSIWRKETWCSTC